MPQINILTFGLNTALSYSMCIPPGLMSLHSGFQTLIINIHRHCWGVEISDTV